jgi:histidinol dehydrogenase
MILARSLSEAAELSNRFAPEHLELAVARPDLLIKRIRHAGAIFLGHRTSVVLGDFVAGPNHVLPTAGTARFFSPLGAQDFVKRSSVIEVEEAGLQRLGPWAESLARLEGLPGHAEAIRVRLDSEKGMRRRGVGRAGRRTG